MKAAGKKDLHISNAPINVKQAGGGGGGGGRTWDRDLTFSKNLQSIPPPPGEIIPVKCNQIAPPRAAHYTVKYPKAGPKNGTIKISPNKTLKSLFILKIRCCITKIHVPVTSLLMENNSFELY